MLEILWLPEAQQDISRLHEFLVEKNANAAKKMINLLIEGSQQLLEYPEIGKPLGDELKRRELFLPFGASSYVLRYRLHENNIVIIRVWHSKELR